MLQDDGYRLDAVYEREGRLRSPTFPELTVRLAAAVHIRLPCGTEPA